MKQLPLILFLLFTICGNAQPPGRYLVRFRDKAGTTYQIGQPGAFLSQRAIDRRLRHGITIDSTDLPVPPRYLDSIRAAGNVVVLNVSRWLNQVSIQTSDAAALEKIAAFPFVENAKPIAARIAGTGRKKKLATAPDGIVLPPLRQNNAAQDYFDYGASFAQVDLHQGQFLHNIGLRGQGVLIGVLDAGFFQYTNLRAFDSVNKNGQVLDTYDFVQRESSVAEDHPHGMACFSVMAANIPGQFVGTAPKAAYLLFRTEDAATEYPIEEHNWVCGAERVDSTGGDVISSSLGYSNGMDDPEFDHTYADMNGKTTIAARGASLAVKKGLLVFNAAGNQGTESFRYIATPADGINVMAVGAVDRNRSVAPFSSYGPAPDGRVKPDLASLGVATVVQTTGNTIGTSNGTSFACPNLAGLASCLWQGFPELNNMAIINALQEAGDRATAPDHRTGYGIPDVKKAMLRLLQVFSTASVTSNGCSSQLTWTSKDVRGMRYEIERKTTSDTAYKKVAEKNATATGFGTQVHRFDDDLANVPAGPVLYRIRQVIDTASQAAANAVYIDTVSLALGTGCISPTATYKLSPNPAPTTITLQVTTPDAVPKLGFRILDSKGTTLSLRRTSKAAGTASFDFPVHHLPRGTYFLAVYSDEKRLIVKRFVRL